VDAKFIALATLREPSMDGKIDAKAAAKAAEATGHWPGKIQP